MRGASLTMLHQPTPRTDLAHWANETDTVINIIGDAPSSSVRPFDGGRAAAGGAGHHRVTIGRAERGTDDRSGRDRRGRHRAAAAHVRIHRFAEGRADHARELLHQRLRHDRPHQVRHRGRRDRSAGCPCSTTWGWSGFLSVPMQVGAEWSEHHPDGLPPHALLWAELMGKYKGTMTAAPNFAYSLLARRLQAGGGRRRRPQHRPVHVERCRARRPGDDEQARRGGRPLRPEPAALAPVYGMAETTLAVSIPGPDQGQVPRPRRPGSPRGHAARRPVEQAERAAASPPSERWCRTSRDASSTARVSCSRPAVSASSKSAARRSPPDTSRSTATSPHRTRTAG